MKTTLASGLLLAAAMLLTGCESDLPPSPKTEGPVVRGLSGQGKIVPIDKRNDPMINTAPAGNTQAADPLLNPAPAGNNQ